MKLLNDHLNYQLDRRDLGCTQYSSGQKMAQVTFNGYITRLKNCHFKFHSQKIDNHRFYQGYIITDQIIRSQQLYIEKLNSLRYSTVNIDIAWKYILILKTMGWKNIAWLIAIYRIILELDVIYFSALPCGVSVIRAGH